jgi:murein DD-endopeptidase MepM/ murein hydrolase activator NlpD
MPVPGLISIPGCMAKGHETDDGLRKHRPLPSIEMALLPHELRAVRARNAAIVLFGLSLLVIGLGLSIARPWINELFARTTADSGNGWPAPKTSTPAAAATPAPCDPKCVADAEANAKAGARNGKPAHANGAVPSVHVADGTQAVVPAAEADARDEQQALDNEPWLAPGAAANPGAGHIVQHFGQARGFRDALVKAGASGVDADAIVAAFDKLVDFRRAQPDDELVLDRDAGGHLVSFEYHASVTERFRADRKPEGGFKGARIKVEVEHRRIAKGGFIADSLGKALEAQGIRSNIAGAFVEAFENRIDFKKHSRQGDSFKLILEEDYVDGQPLGYGRLHALQYKGERAGEALAIWFEPEPNTGGDFFDETGRAMHGGWLRTPLRYDHISSPYNLRRRHPILKRIMPHEGIDYAAAPGTTVWAAADGVVTFVGPRGANGNLIALQHSGGYETFYAHLLRVGTGLKRGVKVKQRQTIGAVGSTGRSTGPHLHFALKRNGRFVDPATQLNGPGKPMGDSGLPKFKRAVAQLKREMATIVLAPAPAPSGEGAESADDFHEESIDL